MFRLVTRTRSDHHVIVTSASDTGDYTTPGVTPDWNLLVTTSSNKSMINWSQDVFSSNVPYYCRNDGEACIRSKVLTSRLTIAKIHSFVSVRIIDLGFANAYTFREFVRHHLQRGTSPSIISTEKRNLKRTNQSYFVLNTLRGSRS